MNLESKVLREIGMMLMNAFAISFIFDLMNMKNTAAVIVGLFALAVVVVLDGQYIRKVIIPMFKKSTEKLNG